MTLALSPHVSLRQVEGGLEAIASPENYKHEKKLLDDSTLGLNSVNPAWMIMKRE